MNVEKIYSDVKDLMLLMGFDIDDKGIPVIEPVDDGAMELCNMYLAAYLPDQHKVIYRKSLFDLEDKSIAFEMLAHELTHSLQSKTMLLNVSENITAITDEYWNSLHERQAFTIGALYCALKYDGEMNIASEIVESKRKKILTMIEDGEGEKLIDMFMAFYKNIYMKTHEQIKEEA